MITAEPSLTDAILDLARLVPNPPHRSFKSTKCQEWAGRAICASVPRPVNTNALAQHRLTSKTLHSTPLLIDSRTYL